MSARWHTGLVGLVVTVALLVVAGPADAASVIYVTNPASANVSAFAVGASGALTEVPGSPFAAGTEPTGAAVTPEGGHLYVADESASTVLAFSIGANGALSAVPGSPFPTGSDPSLLAVTPDGAHLYVANAGANDMSAFSIGANGALSAVAGSPFATGTRPVDVAVTPDGGHAYVTNSRDGTVSAFSIGANGALSAVAGSPFAAGSGPVGDVVTPDGADLYVSDNDFNGTVSAFAIGPTGALRAVPGSPFAAGSYSTGVAVSPDGAHLYVANNSSSDVSGFSIGADGTLSAVPGSPFATGSGPTEVAMSPDGGHAYVTDGSDATVSAFSVSGNGALSAVAGSPFAVGTNPAAVVVTPDQGPVAGFSTNAAPAGSASAFDGSSSRAPDGTIVRYDWSFGDGTSLADGGSTPNHMYATPGSYTVTLTVTDDEGCSTGQTFTGQTMSCNGSPAARVSQQLTVPGRQQQLTTTATTTTTTTGVGIGTATGTGTGAVTIAGQPLQPLAVSVRASTSQVTATLKISCTGGGAGASCTGPISLTSHATIQGKTIIAVAASGKPAAAVAGSKKKPKPKSKATTLVTVARHSYSVPSGQSRTIALSLNRVGRALLAKLYTLPVTLSLGGSASSTARIRFVYPKVPALVAYRSIWRPKGRGDTISDITVINIPKGATVRFACLRGNCSPRSETFAVKSRTTLSMGKTVITLEPEATVAFEVTHAGQVGHIVEVADDGAGATQQSILCLPPGARHPSKCA